jgi:hypothetical protein
MPLYFDCGMRHCGDKNDNACKRNWKMLNSTSGALVKHINKEILS